MSSGDGARGHDSGIADGDVAGCQKLFSDFARQTAKGTPLYSRIAHGVANDPQLAGLLLVAPVAQRLPVLLLACVHSLVLDETDSELASFYPNVAGPAVDPGDPAPAFARFCRRHHDQLVQRLATRRTQTNEVGRTALFLPCFGRLSEETGSLAHVDVGSSAGLNLLIAHYDFVYEPGGEIRIGGPVTLTCGTRGPIPVPDRHPPVASAVGIDHSPIDVRDPEQSRWLEACVWPDQVARFARLTGAIALARDVGVDVVRGDAIADVARIVERVGGSGHPVITTSWVLNYLSARARRDFVAELDRIGDATDLSLVYAESPALCPELPGIPQAVGPDQPTAVVIVRWRNGRRVASHVADAHPHGDWMHWSPMAHDSRARNAS